MGAIKEKIYELAELVYQIMDAGAIDQEEIDEYIESQVSPEEYEFYYAHKNAIFDIISEGENEEEDEGFEPNGDSEGVDESFDIDYVMPRLNEDFDEEDNDDYDDDDICGACGETPDMCVCDKPFPDEDDDLEEDHFDNDEEYPEDSEDFGLGDPRFSTGEIETENDGLTDDENYYCENCGDNFINGICPECGASQEEYGSVDEGCNCGGKKRPIISIIRRPSLIRRPPIKKIESLIEDYKMGEDIIMPSLNEVDWAHMAQVNRDVNRVPRYVGGYDKEMCLKKDVALSGDEKYDYAERKEARKHIERKHEILKDMGYDLDRDEESPELAPTRKELRGIKDPVLMPQLLKHAGRFNKLRGELGKEETLMDRLHKKHAKNAKFE